MAPATGHSRKAIVIECMYIQCMLSCSVSKSRGTGLVQVHAKVRLRPLLPALPCSDGPK